QFKSGGPALLICRDSCEFWGNQPIAASLNPSCRAARHECINSWLRCRGTCRLCSCFGRSARPTTGGRWFRDPCDTNGRMGLIRLRWGLLILLTAIATSLANCSSSNKNAPNPSPIITSIFPDHITAGSAMFVVDLGGQGFINKPESLALWNGSPRTTTVNVSTAHLTITVLAADVTNPSVALISVINPAPGGGTSSGATFTINPLQNGAPTNISLNPSSANAGTKGPFKLTVNGMNFVAGSIIRWNGTFRQSTSVSSTALTTDLTTTDLALAGFASVSVDNPLPGGIIASSVSVDFVINSAKGASTSSPQVISVNAAGGPADGASAAPAMSGDGRFVAFYSVAKNLVREGASGNIFVRDTCLGLTNCTPHTVAVDLAPDGSAPNARAY